ncbi:hypothetical protein [Halalkalicoccus salilacus]|uniref:hypothetical protein n=1 Tax=Halalkalicoccus TaxID=332246 RepID=UPI002F967EF6
MQGHRVLGQLDDIPVIGPRIASVLASRDLTVAEIRYRQERVLKERRASLEKNLSGITGCDADQLSMDDVINVLEESWTGERVVSEERDDRSLPLVTMAREYTETQGDMRSPDQLADDELDQQIIEDLQQSAANVDQQQPDADVEGTTDLSDEDFKRKTISDGDLDDTPDDEGEEPETEGGPDEVPSRSQNGTEAEVEDGDAISVDMDEYSTLEEACAALVEEMERSAQSGGEVETTDHDSDTDAERPEAMI